MTLLRPHYTTLARSSSARCTCAGKINDIMKIWINLNKWLHIICLTLKTMTTVCPQSGKLLSASVRDCAAEATDHCSHRPPHPKSATQDPDEAACHRCVLVCTGCTSRIRKMTDCRYFSKRCVWHCSGPGVNSFGGLHLEAAVRFCWVVWHCEGGVITFRSSWATQRLCEECCRCPPSCRPAATRGMSRYRRAAADQLNCIPLFFSQQMDDLVKKFHLARLLSSFQREIEPQLFEVEAEHAQNFLKLSL